MARQVLGDLRPPRAKHGVGRRRAAAQAAGPDAVGGRRLLVVLLLLLVVVVASLRMHLRGVQACEPGELRPRQQE